MIGEVVSNKMDKTAVVKVTRRVAHPVYGKYVTKSKKYYTHDAGNACQVGDKVVIEATRPLSKLKRWRVLEIIQSSAEPGTEV